MRHNNHNNRAMFRVEHLSVHTRQSINSPPFSKRKSDKQQRLLGKSARLPSGVLTPFVLRVSVKTEGANLR
jgi:hypothetical protein